jgi:hypothetical protein
MMNGLDCAVLGTLTRVVKHFEDAAQDAEFATWKELLMLAAPYKAALVNAAYNGERGLTVRYLGVAQLGTAANEAWFDLADLAVATGAFADAVALYDGAPGALQEIRELGTTLQQLAGRAARGIVEAGS